MQPAVGGSGGGIGRFVPDAVPDHLEGNPFGLLVTTVTMQPWPMQCCLQASRPPARLTAFTKGYSQTLGLRFVMISNKAPLVGTTCWPAVLVGIVLVGIVLVGMLGVDL